MRSTFLTLALAVPLASLACDVGGGDGGDIVPDGQISGAITTDQTWTDSVTLTGDATIEAGVTVTIAAGTRFEAAAGATLRVAGDLIVDGTAAAPVTMNPRAGATAWAGVVVDAGGAATLTYAEGANVATLLYCHAGAATCALDHVTFHDLNKALQNEATATIKSSHLSKVGNGGVTAMDGTLTITDTTLLTSSGDIVVQSGGAMTIEYSEIGEAADSYEHCNIHIGGATALTIKHSTIRAAVYGMMIGGTSGAIITNNNFLDNDAGNDISEVGTNSGVDMRFNFWSQGAPTALGAAYNVSSPAATAYADAHPRG